MNIVKNRQWFYGLSIFLVVGSLLAILIFGLKLSIDFKGGSITEVSYQDGRPTKDVLQNAVTAISEERFKDASVRETGTLGYIVRTQSLSNTERDSLIKTLQTVDGKKGEIKRFDSIGPILGQELARKSVFSIVLVIFAIVLFITFAFRKVSYPVASWKYGLIAITALLHDVIVPTGFFALMGHFYGYEVDSLFITALLVVLGFSIHDTIVVFDRVRENLNINREFNTKKPFELIVGESVSQTLTRSINTSVTVLLSLIVLYIFGPESTRNFSLVMFVGILVGTYSSVFLGSPLLVTIEKWSKK